MVRYIGVDLAWGERNTTAVVVLEGMESEPREGARFLALADALTNDEAIVDWIRTWDTGEDLFIAVDAPTLVPNQTGRRPCEAILTRCLRKEEAGPHPANRNLLTRNGAVRGERLVELLSAHAIVHTPYLDTLPHPRRAVFEVFPHPAHIALFGLERTLKYKAKPDRTKKQRLLAFRQYVALLEGLASSIPPLHLPAEADFFLRRDPEELLTSGLKRYEDALDALTCAYIALYRHTWGDARCPVVGDMTTGYIVTPATESMQECFARFARPSGSPILEMNAELQSVDGERAL